MLHVTYRVSLSVIILPRLFACTVVNERNERIRERERDGKTERKNGRKREREREKKEEVGSVRVQEGTRGRGFRGTQGEEGGREREREREEGREAAFTSIRNLLPYPILKYRG